MYTNIQEIQRPIPVSPKSMASLINGGRVFSHDDHTSNSFRPAVVTRVTQYNGPMIYNLAHPFPFARLLIGHGAMKADDPFPSPKVSDLNPPTHSSTFVPMSLKW